MSKTCEAMKLTKRSVDTAGPLIEADGVRQRLYFDTALRGFGLCVGTTAKTYFAQRSVNGRSRRITIGRHGTPFERITVGKDGKERKTTVSLTVDEARREAQQLLAKMARGIDPVAEKEKARARGFTLRQALALCEQTLKTTGKSEKTASGYRYNVETYLRDWLDRPLAEITRDEAQRRHLKIAADVAAGRFSNGRERGKGSGKATADGVMVAFRAVYGRALRGHPDLPVCPTINVDFFRPKREKKELPLSRLHEWHRHAAALENPIRRDYLLFTLHTGLRRASAAEVEWPHVDFECRVLHVPDPKGGRAFDLPLTDYLVRLLKARRKENEEIFEDSPWAFPAVSASGHIAAPREDFEGIKWTTHDLRRWFITAAESLNLSRYVIAPLVNHRMPGGDVTAGYVQQEVERLRPEMEKIGAKLRALCKAKAAR